MTNSDPNFGCSASVSKGSSQECLGGSPESSGSSLLFSLSSWPSAWWLDGCTGLVKCLANWWAELESLVPVDYQDQKDNFSAFSSWQTMYVR